MILRVLLISLVSFAICRGPAIASSTGLVVIPTAEVIGDRVFSAEIDFFSEPTELGADQRFLGTEFGWGDRLEAGVNYDFSNDPTTTWFFDAKYLVSTGRFPAAIGVSTVCAHISSSPYVMGMASVGTGRLHYGAARIDGASRLMVGADTGFADRTWTFMADYISGSDGTASVGVNCQFNPSFGVILGTLFPNSGGKATLALQVFYTGSY